MSRPYFLREAKSRDHAPGSLARRAAACIAALTLFSASALVAEERMIDQVGAFETERIGNLPLREVQVTPSLRAALARVLLQCEGRPMVAAVAATGSMFPTFDEHYIVVLEECSFESVQRGDVILARGERPAPYIHRVVHIYRDGRLETRGDACVNSDAKLTDPGNYLGRRVVAAIHRRSARIVWLEPEEDRGLPPVFVSVAAPRTVGE